MNSRNLINNKALALACVLFVLLMLTACGGGSGNSPVTPEPIIDR